MELKEYIQIFKKHFQLFLIVIVLTILAGIIFQFTRPLNYKAALTLNVTRIGSQQTDAYKYDDFYRLQADEKFADTVVRWLGSPRIVADIYNDARVSGERIRFKAQRLSSQMIQVTFIATDAKAAQNLASSVVKIINTEADKLNQFQKEEMWFKILGEDPIVTENKFKLEYVLLAMFALGIFLGIWGVMIKHYLE
jgi:capsular polysaccharide biosynthesis protein